jgi:bacterioferritin-associated ferredoxin
MIICSCNVITDQDVRSVIDLASPRRTAEVYICLGCNPRCGRCARTIKRIMADAIEGRSLDCRCGGCPIAPAVPS